MEIFADEEAMASFPDIDEVSSVLKGHSRFFTEIGSVTEALKKLNHFLVGADSESVEKLMAEFTESLVDQTEECFEEDCLSDLLRILQESRVVDFISRAGSQIRSQVSRARELRNRKLVYSFIDEFFNPSEKHVLAWLTEEAPESSIISEIDINDLRRRILMEGGRLDPHYWIDVSGSYKIANLIEIAKEQKYGKPRSDQPLRKVLHVSSEMELVRKLVSHSLQRNRYMFVLDDGFHQEFWHVIEQAFRDNEREAKFGDSLRQGSFDLGPLSVAESWQLFSGIAFQDEPEQRCPMELKLLSEEILRMCKGFRLPIMGIAGLLSKRGKHELEWQRVRNGFTLDVKTNQRFLDVPARSYLRDLPDHLLQCFSYFRHFPRHTAIRNDKLFRLWIAEGFVAENGANTLEELAEEYLNELIRRNLVQPYQGLNRLEQYCRVGEWIPQSKHPRRSIFWRENVDPKVLDSDLHSLFVYNRDFFFVIIDMINQCEALKVLTFEYCGLNQLPEELGNLIQLKYLSLKNTRLRMLPKSVEKLVNLQTLDVRNTLLVELPVEINKLKNLQHLLGCVRDEGTGVDPIRGVRLKKGIGRLHNLRTLMTVEAHNNSVMTELAALDQLTTLSVSRLAAKTVKALCTCIDKLVRLKSLSLQAVNGEKVLNLARISSQLPLLQRLVLKGVFQNLPDWIFRLQNLSVLWLSLTELTEEQLIHLSHLPNLVSLWLCRAYKERRLYLKEGSFKRLKLLVLREFHGLYELEIEDGALCCLEELRIGSSPLLSEVPSGIQYLENLKTLVNYDMPKEFVVSMQPNGGSDYWKVKHIPCVFFLYRVQGREYKLFELGDSELLDYFQGLATNAHSITEPQEEHVFTFCKSSDEDEDNIGPSNFHRDIPTFLQKNKKQWSFSSSMYTDDVEE